MLKLLTALSALRISRGILRFFQANALRSLKVLEGSGGHVMRHCSPPADATGFEDKVLRRKSSGLTGLPQRTYTPGNALRIAAQKQVGLECFI